MSRDWYDSVAVAAVGLSRASEEGASNEEWAGQALDAATKLTGGSAGYLCWANSGGEAPRCLACLGADLGLEKADGRELSLPVSHPLWRAMIKQGYAIWSGLSQDIPSGQDLPPGLRDISWICLPLHQGSEVRGQITLAGAPDGYGLREAAGMGVLAGVCQHGLGDPQQINVDSSLSIDKLRTIFDLAPIGITFWDGNGNILQANNHFTEMLGYPREELLGKHYFQLSHPDDLPRQLVKQQTFWEQGLAQYNMEKRYIRRDGQAVWCNVTVSAIRDPHGWPSSILAISEDISARKEAESRLRRAEAEKTVILNAIEEFVLFLSPDLGIMWANEAAAKMVGIRSEKIRGRICHRFWFGRKEPCSDCPVIRSLQSGRPEDQSLDPGDGRLLMLHAYPIQDDMGRVFGVVELVRDITEQHQAEQALKRSEERYRTLVQNLPGAVYRCELNFPYKTTYLSENIQNLTGYSAEEMNSGQAPALGELIHDEDLPKVQISVKQSVEKGEPFELEYRIRHRDGSLLGVHEVGRAICDEKGKPKWLDGVILDVTGRRALEGQLQQAHKLRSLADVTGGVAHDFNNMLAGVLGYAELLRDTLEQDSDSINWLNKLERSAQRAADLTRQMLAYTGRWLHRPEMINLSGHLERMTIMLGGLVGGNIELNMILDPNPPPLLVDTAQLTQVVLALVTNSQEAIGEQGGVITLKTGQVHMDKSRLLASYLYEEQVPGEYLSLEIIDNGVGFDSSQRDRLFDPFFTTKFTGRGMGLAVVLGIIRQHKGAIEVKSSPGMETMFRILFPVSETQTATDSPDDASNILSASDLTILVADDEDSVLDSTSLWLDSRGVNVWRASGGQQAIELIKQNSQKIDLVLLDLTMPDMDSGEVVQRLREIDPKIPVILASGYSESDLAGKARDLGVAAFQPKPYDFNRLLATIMRVVSRK